MTVELPTAASPVAVLEGDRYLLPDVPRDAAAVVITDPPYGMALASHGGMFRGMRPVAGDDDQQVGELVIEYCRARKWPVLAFANPKLPWRGDWRQHLVWDKGEAVGGGGDIDTCWKFSWELVQVGQFPKVFGRRDGAVLRFPISAGNYTHHPCQKPLALMRYLVRKLTRPGDLVIDPFAGSGSTPVACAIEGRRCLAVESFGGYVAVIRSRVAQALGEAAGQLTAGLAPPADLFTEDRD